MMLASLSLLVFAAPAQEQDLGTVLQLPAVGSPEALESQEAFRTWSDGLEEVPFTPFALDYRFDGKLRVLDPSDGTDMDGSFTATGSSLYIKLNEFHHAMEITLSMDGETRKVPVDILFGGDRVELHVGALPDADLPDGVTVTVSQPLLEEAYLLYLELMPQMMNMFAGEPGMEFVPDMSGLFEELVMLMPPDLPTYIHPAGMFRYGLRSFTCRQFQLKDGIVEAQLILDTQEGSILDSIIKQAATLFGEFEEEDLEMAEVQEIIDQMADAMQIHAKFDAVTGIPVFLEMDMEISQETFGEEGEEGEAHLQFRYEGQLLRLTDPSSLRFDAPEASENSIDVTGFLQMGVAQIRSMLYELESGEDMDF